MVFAGADILFMRGSSSILLRPFTFFYSGLKKEDERADLIAYLKA